MTTAGKSIDVLGLGAVTIDDLVYVDAYPPADAKIPILRAQRHCGGLTGTALVAASRLGSKCAYAGVLGADGLSAHIIDRLREEGVDTGHVLRRAGVNPIHAFIVVDEARQTRNVFVDLTGKTGADPNWPSEETLLSTRVLFVDHIGVPGMIRAGELCRAHGIPVVADFEHDAAPDFPRLLALVDHLILSQSFAEKVTGLADPAKAAERLWGPSRNSVAVTGGRAGCWYAGLETGGKVLHHPAYQVVTVDTTGCGDVFHGAYASALAEGVPLARRIAFASAAAALKATRPGGQEGIPTKAAVEDFLAANPAVQPGRLAALNNPIP